MQDTGHILFDAHGCGSEKRQLLDEQIKTGERTFKDVSEEMWGSLNVPFDDGFEVMQKTLEIDPGFHDFHKFCVDNEIPFNIISAGLRPVLQKVLDAFLGEEEASKIDIVANEAEITEDGKTWKPVWLHGDSDLGHDKAVSMQEAKKQASAESKMANKQVQQEDEEVPLIVFIGDGVSDLPAAREADVLFARKGLRLEEYCVEHGIKYLPFDSFADIQKKLQEIIEEDEQKTGGKGVPARFNPRANMWRRVSSRNAVPRYVVMTPSKEKMFLWPEAFTELANKPIPELTKEPIAIPPQMVSPAQV
ncbi:2,3-diketo-5-methylthio-1-phosphopentane phosphatase [Podospora australis]|uniref:2,3-diketo-5-methylthio-1-phosphopentane phosphatase n=1 Tax=Podospora australis TaxID=1536484 RepID=A0AAN7AN65_9PEZI|nr:2,3-diketo-5-methylthio-1-phosphopentane phosphatase [Podospora australis]